MEKKKLRMTFDPNTIEHLGVKMYSNLPNALAELIANAYDADATEVVIKLIENKEEKEVQVIDNGIGMTFEEINDSFLRIGRNRRQFGDQKSRFGRKVTGKKGLGKLALFGIGEKIDIETTKTGNKQSIVFTLDWNQIRKPQNTSEYEPTYKIIDKKSADKQGTTVTLKQIKRKSAFDPYGLAVSLSKLFNCFDASFSVRIEHKNEKITVDRELKYKSIQSQFKWSFSDLSDAIKDDYTFKDQICGEIISTEKPISPALRGITLFARGRLVNLPEFFGAAESSHGFSYLTGWLNIDFIDDENENEDVIATDRQSLNWEALRTSNLRAYLKKAMGELVRQWRAKRNEARRKDIQQKTDVNVAEWYSKLPDNLQKGVEKIIDTVVEKSELSREEFRPLVTTLHEIIPEYPYYHWRHLHSEIHSASEHYYKNGDFYHAFSEAVKRYVNQTKLQSNYPKDPDRAMMGSVFGQEADRVLKVAKKYKRPNGSNFDELTISSIEDGQKHLSMGVVAGCRNPISHELVADLRDSKLFTEKDCLDALSLLSHLFRRLDDAK